MRKESETPSGIRLMLLLKGHLREIMNRECANQTFDPFILYGILLGRVRTFRLSIASCLSG